MVKNLTANAGDTGLIPGPGRSHMPRSNWAHAPHLLSLCSRAHAHIKRSEKPAHRNLEYPHSPQPEPAQQRRPNTAKNNNNNNVTNFCFVFFTSVKKNNNKSKNKNQQDNFHNVHVLLRFLLLTFYKRKKTFKRKILHFLCINPMAKKSSMLNSQMYWESQLLSRLIRSLGVPKERGVWNFQVGGEDKLFFLYIP